MLAHYYDVHFMGKNTFNRLGLKLLLLVFLVLPELAGAQYFTDTQNGDVVAGFRKTGTYQEPYEMIVYLGNITNFLNIPAGSTINITNLTYKALTNMCPDNLANLQWSVFSSFSSDPLSTAFGDFPYPTCWYTYGRTNVNVQRTAPARSNYNLEPILSQKILSVSDSAYNIGANYVKTTGAYNNTNIVLEPWSINDGNDMLTHWVGSAGNFGGNDITFNVENITPGSFTSTTVSDFFQDVPASSPLNGTFTDPITSQNGGSDYWVGSFAFNANGTMTFTRGYAMTATVTNGASPLKVVFTNTASGNITNWVWNFGNGTIITNTTGANVTNTYAAAGSYTVILTLNGPNGSSTITYANYIVVAAGVVPPVAGFTATPTNGSVPLTVVFTNTSTTSGSITNVWNFGNGTMITNLTSGNVTNVYTTNGIYTVGLTVNGAGGSSSTNQTNYIVVTPSAGFTGTPTNGFAPLKIIFTNTSTAYGSITNVWNFGNGTSITNTTGASVTNTYATNGIYPVSLTVNGPGGSSLISNANYITVAPSASFTGTPTNGFAPLTVVFTNNSIASGSITNVWNLGNGTSITNTTAANVTNTFVTAGNYTVALIVNGPGGFSTNRIINYIYAAVPPVVSAGLSSSGGGSAGGLGFSGTNLPPGATFRILNSTNLLLPKINWTPVFTNTVSANGSFSCSVTNLTNSTGYFILSFP